MFNGYDMITLNELKVTISMSRRPKMVLHLIILLLIVAAGSAALVSQHQIRGQGLPHATGHTARIHFLGVVTQAPAAENLRAFAETTGIHPNLNEYYIPWGLPFNRVTADEIASTGTLPMISWEPFAPTTTIADIASGRQNAYINSWAHAIATYHRRIAISFAAEMNGSWEDWGPTHATAAQFVSAWRIIHDLFVKAHAINVTWVWTVNIVNGLNVPLRPYWPGSSYVDWVGVDGYWWGHDPSAGLTFSALFYPTLAQVRQFTERPVLIAETGGAPGYKVMAVNNLFYGVEHTPGMLGFVWFNIKTRAIDFRLQNSPTAIAAYRLQAKSANFTDGFTPTP